MKLLHLYSTYVIVSFNSDETFTGYVCKRQGCWIDDSYISGIDVGVYHYTGADCASCQARCNSDPICGAVECNKDHCYWWGHGKCINSYSPNFFTYNEEDQSYHSLMCYKRSK